MTGLRALDAYETVGDVQQHTVMATSTFDGILAPVAPTAARCLQIRKMLSRRGSGMARVSVFGDQLHNLSQRRHSRIYAMTSCISSE